MGVYATIKVSEKNKSGFSKTLLDFYMIEIDDETSFLDCFLSVARSSAMGSSLFKNPMHLPSPKDEVVCYISPTKDATGQIRDPNSKLNNLKMLLGKELDVLLTETPDLSTKLNELKIEFKQLQADIKTIIDSGEKLFVKGANGEITMNEKFMKMDLKLIMDFMKITGEMEDDGLRCLKADSKFRFVEKCLQGFADQVWNKQDMLYNLNTIIDHSASCLESSVNVIVTGAFIGLPTILDANESKENRKAALEALILVLNEVTDEVAHVTDFVEKLIEIHSMGESAAVTFAKCSFDNVYKPPQDREDCKKKALAAAVPPPPPPPPPPPQQQPAGKRQMILHDLTNLLQTLKKNEKSY